jgi:aspartyl-tRNA(Asn)/glutamyl-tRNA(Gln) amidotransferase subunit C
MALTIDEVRRIAALARLRLTPEEEQRFVPQLGRIVEYIDHLREYPAATAPPVTVAAGEREDVIGACLSRALVLGNAPETLDEFVVVPQVKGGGDA